MENIRTTPRTNISEVIIFNYLRFSALYSREKWSSNLIGRNFDVTFWKRNLDNLKTVYTILMFSALYSREKPCSNVIVGWFFATDQTLGKQTSNFHCLYSSFEDWEQPNIGLEDLWVPFNMRVEVLWVRS